MDSFIAQYENQFSDELSDKLVRIIDRSISMDIAKAGKSGAHNFDEKIKKSTDLDLTDELGIEEVDTQLLKVMNSRLSAPLHHYVNNYIPSRDGEKDYLSEDDIHQGFILLQPPRLKMYRAPSDGYFAWHQDWGVSVLQARRLLVAMVYLNDVEEGGETAFYHQKIKIKPKKGRMVIFPPYFTHMHKGMSPISNDKYICNFYLGLADAKAEDTSDRKAVNSSGEQDR